MEYYNFSELKRDDYKDTIKINSKRRLNMNLRLIKITNRFIGNLKETNFADIFEDHAFDNITVKCNKNGYITRQEKSKLRTLSLYKSGIKTLINVRNQKYCNFPIVMYPHCFDKCKEFEYISFYNRKE